MNKIYLIGNLTKDPELTETTNGVKICRFSLAVNRDYAGADGERKTDFFDCVAWRGRAETIAKYLRKGNKVAVNGSVERQNYEDNKGVKRTSFDVVVRDIEFLSTNKTDDAEKVNKNLQPFDDNVDIPF